MKMLREWLVIGLSCAVITPPGLADPCGMVPPIWLGNGQPIMRTGVQMTYVFYKDGMESIVLRPGFSGKVDEFGMLIPFPSPPAIRKVAEDVFGHVAAAIDPPEVVVDLRARALYSLGYAAVGDMEKSAGRRDESLRLRREEVVVLSEEAVGMYEVAVLAAGGAEALAEWMNEHGFRYPTGMDATCEEYVEQGWCFVAVKARVGDKRASEPRPGMRSVDVSIGPDTGFDGHVQAMGFRFRTDELIVPMRLSTFNEGELHNVVYVLTDGPRKIAGIPDELVVRQIPGYQLYRNVVEPLPLRVVGGNLAQIPEWRRQNLPQERDPFQYNGIAKELFASDLLAVMKNRLAHPHEEVEKELLAICEELGLRGPDIEAQLQEALKIDRDRVVNTALQALHGMTLTVVDGDFPRETLAADDLRFPAFAMGGEKNAPRLYDAKHLGPAPPMLGGTLGGGTPSMPSPAAVFAAAALGLFVCAAATGRRRLARCTVGAGFLCVAATAVVAQTTRAMETPATVDTSLSTLVERGWQVVELADAEGARTTILLEAMHAVAETQLERTWLNSALVKRAVELEDLEALTRRLAGDGALRRPLSAAWRRFLASTDTSLEALLRAIQPAPGLQQEILPSLLRWGPAAFVDVLYRSDDQNVRRLAAGCLATMSRTDHTAVVKAVFGALHFDPTADEVPWVGGPLFIPSATWTRGEARQLAGDLLSWMLFCDFTGKLDERNQVQNNLRSVGLANTAGFEPIWGGAPTEQWLLHWGRAFGRGEVERILALHGVTEDPRLAAVLKQLDD